MQNYHKHSCGSNIYTPDSAVFPRAYAERAVELGHKVLSSVEHGWQGKYHEYYELAKKYNLKFIFGAEAYWVRDRLEKDKTNCHIVVLARNENGRQAINEALSVANEDGYFYKPRLDLELLLSLPPEDVFLTSACVAFWQYEDVEEIVAKLHNHFQNNFMLEIQYHNTERQKDINLRIKDIAHRLGIEMIVGLDSHYIYPEQAETRTELLLSSDIHYPDEDGWYMDYPDDATVKQRFLEQGVFTEDEINRAMANTDVMLEFEDYKSQVFEHNRKLPTLYPDETQEQKDKRYSVLISKLFKEYMKNVDESEYGKYFEGVKMEVQTYKETGMTDYPLIDYAIVKRGIEKGGVITSTGRGSGCGYFTNTLCGFSKIDRFQSPIKLYPERFISKTRIIESNSLPDIDMNVASQEPFEEAQREILGEDHAYPMIAFGTLKKKAAFKMYARAQKLDFAIANAVSDQISRYDEAMKYADDDERESINIYDFVDEKYHDLVRKSQEYWGIIKSKAKAPCAYLLYQGSIRKEIGLIRCKSEATKREYITTVVDGAVAEEYKFLKNDWLIVDTVYLTDAIFKRVGEKPMNVSELSEIVKDNDRIWRLYANGFTIGINQCEKPNAVKRLMRYQPKNISELSAFIAAIRPGFKSMYDIFESRQPFSYNIPALDNIIQTEQFPYSFIMYQEQLMSVLNLAGFPMDECYGIIKAIAKKHPEKVRPLKARFIEGFKKQIQGQCPPEQTEDEVAEQVWTIIDNSTSYSFNSAHAYSMALDSLYNAYQKAYHPYEFYEVLMERFSAKGKKDKVAALKVEMKQAFDIDEGPIKFGTDNRQFWADPDHKQIVPSLLSIKGLNKSCANDLYRLYRPNKYRSFIDILFDIKTQTRINSKQLKTLICLDYFSDFGNPNQLLKQFEHFEQYNEAKQISKEDIDGIIPHEVMLGMCVKETAKKYVDVDYAAMIYYLATKTSGIKTPISLKIKNEYELLGYVKTTIPTLPKEYCFVLDVVGKFGNKTITLHHLQDGTQSQVKVKKYSLEKAPINQGDIIKTAQIVEEPKWGKDIDGNWYQKSETEPVLKKYTIAQQRGG